MTTRATSPYLNLTPRSLAEVQATRSEGDKAVTKLTIERRPNANGTNLVDKDQPVVCVRWPGGTMLMGRWSTLCLPEGTITADRATDDQIRRAICGDESVFD